jgi:microsomal dipeptidase-like Zn-dependent dipeptidase
MPSTIDIHCHPSLKYYLFGTRMTNSSEAPRDEAVPDMLRMDNLYMSLPRMKRGNVGMIWASHYIPEHDLVSLANIAEGVKIIVQLLMKEKLDKFENNATPDGPFLQLKELMRAWAKHIRDCGAVVPTTRQEMAEARAAGKTVVLHSAEGAHHLGRGRTRNGQPDVQGYVDALEELRLMGLCSLTIGHFFPNDCTANVNGLPPNVLAMMNYPTTFADTGLSAAGDAVVNHMLDNGMIVDLVHSAPTARKRIFELNNARSARRPMIFSHTGIAEVFKRHAEARFLPFNILNPSDDEIRGIKECNGVLGIIMMQYWLAGREEKNSFFGLVSDQSLKYIVESVQHVHSITGSYDHIAIGSDYDGFTDVLDDAASAAQFPSIAQKLNDAGIPAEAVDKIMFGNAMRVLQEGWGN